MKKSILFSVLLLMLSTSLFGQQIDKARLDSLFDRLAAGNKAMGSLALSKNGVLLYSRAIGRVGTAGGQVLPSNTETRYRIGSITKMFTTVMIFQLIEEGKLSLDLTLDKYYPGITHASAITIGQMLQHRSGIHNFTNDPAYEQYMTHPKGEAEMVEIITKAGSDFTPGEKMAYSNSNFVLLGYILERVTGKSYGDNLKERILSKVGMKSTSMGAKTVPGHNEAFSYQYEGEWKQMPETDMSIPGGAGAIVSTPTDLVRFAQALFAGKLISPSSLDRMKTIRDGIGMGLFQIPFYERKAFGHNGGIDGFVSNLAY
ncbi:MAG: beta-lactamase family protein, partial [Marinilabiliales bacterium]|nr:beta-lactamase family protein [Marinilabiliales bacterium]